MAWVSNAAVFAPASGGDAKAGLLPVAAPSAPADRAPGVENGRGGAEENGEPRRAAGGEPEARRGHVAEQLAGTPREMDYDVADEHDWAEL